MKTYQTILYIVVMTIAVAPSSAEDLYQLLLTSAQKFDSKVNLSFNSVYERKFFSRADSKLYSGAIYLRKEHQKISSLVWSCAQLHRTRVVDERFNGIIDSSSKQILSCLVKDSAIRRFKHEPDYFVLKTISGMQNLIRGYLSDTDSVRLSSDTSVGGKQFHRVELFVTSDTLMKDKIVRFTISKSDSSITRIEQVVTVIVYGGGVQRDVIDLRETPIENVSSMNIDSLVHEAGYELRSDADIREGMYATDSPTILQRGQKIPITPIQTLRGRKLSIGERSSKPRIAIFWKIGCPPSEKLRAELSRIVRKIRNVEFIGLNFSDNDTSVVKNYLKTYSYGFECAMIDKSIAEQFGVSGTPEVIAVDTKGLVLFSASGYTNKLTEQIEAIAKSSGRNVK